MIDTEAEITDVAEVAEVPAAAGVDARPPPTPTPPTIPMAGLEISESSATLDTCSIGNTNILTDSNSRFPCIEQPTRVTLHCNGYYLWCKRNGKIIVRKRRNERDEFCLEYEQQNEASSLSPMNRKQEGTLKIKHYKFGGFLSTVQREESAVEKTKAAIVTGVNGANGATATATTTVTSQNTDSTKHTVVCVKPRGEENGNTELNLNATNSNDNEDDDNDNDESSSVFLPTSFSDIYEEDQKWCFIKVSNGTNVMLKSLGTGLNLGIDDDGKIFFGNDEQQNHQTLWTIECVTGELCFISNANPTLREHIAPHVRCDMAGLLSLSDHMKGWEVFRFMEASHDGYVKISSWMHSQWLLCSTKDGRVMTCSHAESFLDYRKDDHDNEDLTMTKVDSVEGEGEDAGSLSNDFRCSKWAIEKDPSGGNGVVIRSKTHGRYLSVRENGELHTYEKYQEEKSLLEEMKQQGLEMEEESQDGKKKRPGLTMKSGKDMEASWRSLKNSIRTGIDDTHKKIQKQKMKMTQKKGDEPVPIVPESETLVWQLEAAHSQSYYFLSLNLEVTNDNKGKVKPKSLGPNLQVTSNLRKNTKVQIIQEDDNITKLCVAQEEKSDKKDIKTIVKKNIVQKFIACTNDGEISLVDDIKDVNAEWIMDKSQYQEGGTYFKSRLHNRYLSHQQSSSDEDGNTTTSSRDESTLSTSTRDKFNDMFRKDKETVEGLFGSETLGIQETWKLSPCMPRAVSSDKIKTFALGTSIAVGTTIAMPFALAGVGAIMGAIGAEVGTLTAVVFAGLTGVEAIASVGAIGATAYLVFRPAENSLTDESDQDDEETEAERAWSKRPFSNWRNW